MGFIKYGYAGLKHRIHLQLPDDRILNADDVQHINHLRNILQKHTGRAVQSITYRDYDDLDFTIASDAELQAACKYAERFDPGGELHIFIRVGDRIPQVAIETAPVSPQSNISPPPNPPPASSQLEQHAPRSLPKPASQLGRVLERPLPKPRPKAKPSVAPARDETPMPRASRARRERRLPAPRVRFDVHDDIACNGCGMDPIVGVRHWCVSRPSLDLCATCRAKRGVDDHLQWRQIKWPWQAQDAAHTVPDAPLWHGHYSPEVKLLQKCLLKLGFLNPQHLDKLTGHYQDNTAKAVAAFREAYEVPEDEEDNAEVYCDTTMHMLAKVLRL